MDIIKIILSDDAVMTDITEKTSRIDICSSCDKLSMDVCSVCGCLVEVRASYKDADCPLGKWNGDTL